MRERCDLYSVPELKERGWTHAMIASLLGKHDSEQMNPKYRTAPPMKLYLKSRVLEVENTPNYTKRREASCARHVAASLGVATRISNIVASVENAELTIVRGKTTEEIRNLAIRTHGGNYAGNAGEFRWSTRTARNCIRHNLTNYERLWSLVNRGETGQHGYELLRERIEALIDEAYPQFARNADSDS